MATDRPPRGSDADADLSDDRVRNDEVALVSTHGQYRARRDPRYPLGNTGGANVSAVQPMDIPADLRAILRGSGAVA